MLVTHAANTGLSPLARKRVRFRSVYPRWRGEHTLALGLQTDGLSPLARGTLQLILRERRPRGLSPLARGTPAVGSIPAGAGNTADGDVCICWRGLSPLARGTRGQAVAALTRVGLSPLARGTLNAAKNERFIPAGAGNTFTCYLNPRWRGEHIGSKKPATAVYPRWRGEHPPSVIQLSRQCGLSPLARGTLSFLEFTARRFIPAGAGNTSVSGLSPLAR